MSKLLAFDLEATGLDTGNDRIVEFCFLALDENLEVNGKEVPVKATFEFKRLPAHSKQ